MRKQQSGFTLVEIAIVLVIIGLLLGGVLKGQELINSAKVKNFANDFRNIPLFIYGYQDKYKALPGDDGSVDAHLGGTCATGTTCKASTPGAVNNGTLEGSWNTTTATDETFLFWQHVRLAGLASGPTNTGDANYIPKNADGGIIGITSGSSIATGGTGGTTNNYAPISTLHGTYTICSQGILGRYVKQLDITLDDGNTATGSLQAMANQGANQTAAASAIATTSIDDATSYTVCMGI
jgi:prepilin-type N-terminal cleavage/methylation domain-containing protein